MEVFLVLLVLLTFSFGVKECWGEELDNPPGRHHNDNRSEKKFLPRGTEQGVTQNYIKRGRGANLEDEETIDGDKLPVPFPPVTLPGFTEQGDSHNSFKKSQEAKLVNTLGADKLAASQNKLLMPRRVILTTSKTNSVACVEVDANEVFASCEVKHPHLTLDLVVSHMNFPLLPQRIHYNRTDLCKPLHLRRKGHFCFEFDNNKIPEGSKIAFKRMFILVLVLDCPERAYKMSSQSFDLLNVPSETRKVQADVLRSCPNRACYKWLADSETCRSPAYVRGIPFPQRRTNRGTEILLIIGIAFGTWLLVMVVIQIARWFAVHISQSQWSSSRTVPDGNCPQLTASDTNCDISLPLALDVAGATGHEDTSNTKSK